VPGAGLEVPHVAPVRIESGRDSRARVAATASRDLPDMCRYRPGTGGVSAVLAARQKRRVFAGSRDQVRRAREFVARTLDACPAVADAVLLTSELATNAVTHTGSGDGGHFTVTVYRSGTWARIEVRDAGSATKPAAWPRVTGAESGYGLELVDLLASRWGHAGGRGRVVWFELEWK
jgi:anti-sigma regulatory factor (Ser/Thr protein kinase)